jgi:DNA-binding transcriptional ArsR family regulator
LKEAGLITEQPRGKWTFYTIAPDRINDFCAALKRISGLGE